MPQHVSAEDVAAEDARLDAALELPGGPVPLADDDPAGLSGEWVLGVRHAASFSARWRVSEIQDTCKSHEVKACCFSLNFADNVDSH